MKISTQPVPGTGVARSTRPPAESKSGSPDTFQPSDYSPYLENQRVDGQKNACGTTSLAGILNYWKNQKTYTRQQLDDQMRHGDRTTSPQQLARFSRSQGYRSRCFNQLSFEQLARLVDQGVPVQVVVQSFVHAKGLHYITATAALRNEAGELSGFRFADTAGAQWRELSLKDFGNRWENLTYKGFSTGLNHPAVIHLPTLPTMVTGADGKVRDASQVEFPTAPSLPWRTWLSDFYLTTANRLTSHT